MQTCSNFVIIPRLQFVTYAQTIYKFLLISDNAHSQGQANDSVISIDHEIKCD